MYQVVSATSVLQMEIVKCISFIDSDKGMGCWVLISRASQGIQF